jgi:hypothetical protein
MEDKIINDSLDEGIGYIEWKTIIIDYHVMKKEKFDFMMKLSILLYKNQQKGVRVLGC